MKSIITLCIVVLLGLANNTQAQSTSNVDPSHSSITFSVGYLGISNVTGNFNAYEGNIKTTNADFTDAIISFGVDVNSINTDVEARDNHLKSPDFFDVAKFPKMTFESTSFKKQGKDYILEGNMTIKGITKKVTFTVKYGGTAKDNYANERTGLSLKGKINRNDYGINGGQGFVGEEVEFTLNLNFIKSK
jgi:polyisoprenoid-binding protein YceI